MSPQGLKGSATQPPPSLNNLIYQINNDKDFDEYILRHASKVPSVRSELQYTRHPTQTQTHVQPTPSSVGSAARRTSVQMQQSQPPSSLSSQPQPQPQPQVEPAQTYPQSSLPEPGTQSTYQDYSSGFPPPQQPQAFASQRQPPQFSGASEYSPVAQNPYTQSEYTRGPAGPAAARQTAGVTYNSSSPPVNPVFGVNLDELFRRDGSPVPMVVYQCIQAVDLFGLEVEGIYRIPGTTSQIQNLKAIFDSSMSTPAKS